MTKAALYLRVSTAEQSTENQLPALQNYAKARGYEISAVYQEQESAWKAGHQHELSRLLSDLRDGRRHYDVLLVWSLDRLCRSGIAAILQLVNTFRTHGCHVVSVQEAWTEQSGPMLELLYSITAWVAKFEGDRKSERVKAGQARAIREGKQLGRPLGRKDKRPRRKSGYYARYARQKTIREPVGFGG